MAPVLEVAGAARRLIASGRALTAADLALPDATIPDAADADVPPAGEPPDSSERPRRLSYRADTAVAAFRAAAQKLMDAVPTDPASTLGATTARTLLAGLMPYDIAGAVPVSPAGDDASARAMLHAQVISVAGELRARVSRLDTLQQGFNAAMATAHSTRDYHLARLRQLFGDEVRVLPRFAPPIPWRLVVRSLRARPSRAAMRWRSLSGCSERRACATASAD